MTQNETQQNAPALAPANSNARALPEGQDKIYDTLYGQSPEIAATYLANNGVSERPTNPEMAAMYDAAVARAAAAGNPLAQPAAAPAKAPEAPSAGANTPPAEEPVLPLPGVDPAKAAAKSADAGKTAAFNAERMREISKEYFASPERKLSESTMQSLRAHGIEDAVVREVLANLDARVKLNERIVYEEAGGADEYRRMVDWMLGTDKLTTSQKQFITNGLRSSNEDEVIGGARTLAQVFRAHYGQDPNLVAPTRATASGGGPADGGFADEREATEWYRKNIIEAGYTVGGSPEASRAHAEFNRRHASLLQRR